MSEQNIPLPEQEPLPSLEFGDLVTSQLYNDGRPSLVVEQQKGGLVQAMPLVDEETNRYGMSGTLRINEIDSVVGHKTFEETIEIIARLYSGGKEPDQTILDRVRNLVAGNEPQEP